MTTRVRPIWYDKVSELSEQTMMTARDMVSRDTPAKKDAEPMRARAPGSIQVQYGSVGTPPCRSTSRRPMARPYNAPMYLQRTSFIQFVTQVTLKVSPKSKLNTKNLPPNYERIFVVCIVVDFFFILDYYKLTDK